MDRGRRSTTTGVANVFCHGAVMKLVESEIKQGGLKSLQTEQASHATVVI